VPCKKTPLLFPAIPKSNARSQQQLTSYPPQSSSLEAQLVMPYAQRRIRSPSLATFISGKKLDTSAIGLHSYGWRCPAGSCELGAWENLLQLCAVQNLVTCFGPELTDAYLLYVVM